jgi:hypothetical protein
MLRHSRASLASRVALAALLALAALPLSGCLASLIPAEAPARTTESPRATPTIEPDAEPSTRPDTGEDADADTDTDAAVPPSGGGGTITFTQGNDLDSATYVSWTDGLMMDDGWTIEAADDGQGNWSYRTADGTCVARFWQGLTESQVSPVVGDDRATTDILLALTLGTDTANITAHAGDASFSYLLGGEGSVDNRSIRGGEGDRQWILSARAFAAVGIGVTVLVDCTGGDPDAVLAEVNEKNAIAVVPSS